MRVKLLIVALTVATVVFSASAPAGAVTADDSNVHGCEISVRVESVVGLDWRRWTDARLSGQDMPACGDIRVEHLTVFTNDNGVSRSASTDVDQLELLLPGDWFSYEAAQIGTFRFARAEFSWCPDGGDQCTTRTRTRIIIYKRGNVLYR
jgi:hypothetical protein